MMSLGQAGDHLDEDLGEGLRVKDLDQVLDGQDHMLKAVGLGFVKVVRRAEHELDQTVEDLLEQLLEGLLALAPVEVGEQRPRPDDKLEHVLQALHGLDQLHRLGRRVVDALLEHDEQLVVGQGGVEVLVDVELQDGDELGELAVLVRDEEDRVDQALEHLVVVDLGVCVLHQYGEQGVQDVWHEPKHNLD